MPDRSYQSRHLSRVFFTTLVLLLPCASGHAQTRTEQPPATESLSAELKAEGVASLAIAARENGNAVRGAILFPQQKANCASCHVPGSRDMLGPDLTATAKDATDDYLVESVLYPSKSITKGFETLAVITTEGRVYTGRIIRRTPEGIALRDGSNPHRLIELQVDDIERITTQTKSLMPDDLVDQLGSRQDFFDLVRYLVEIKATSTMGSVADASKPLKAELDPGMQGLVLMDEFQCNACHPGNAAANLVPSSRAPNLAWIGSNIDPSYIESFIADPHDTKPQSRMPDLMSSMSAQERRSAATELTHYVVSLGEPTTATLQSEPESVQRGSKLFHEVGCVACHVPRDRAGDPRFPEVNNKYSLDALVAYLKDPHAARPSGRMPNMRLTHWEAIDIASYLLEESRPTSAPSAAFTLNPRLVAKGKLRFEQLKCGHCHNANGGTTSQEYPRLRKARSDRGCLSTGPGNWPRFALDASQRLKIRTAIDLNHQDLTKQQQISLTLATFNCLSCHRRDRLGGVEPERDKYFQTTNPNLGPQGRIPPSLTNVGAKLKPRWMRQVLVSGRVIRPYMKTRMPQYRSENVGHLVNLFRDVDQIPVVDFAEFSDQKAIRTAGHELAGTGGLNCIACHNFRQKPAATMPAVDLTEMYERLHKAWFYNYMGDPQRWSPGTVMPSFWPGGQAIRRDILDGDPDLQREALWQYLSDGRQARPPRGLIRKPIELLATDEAVMLRRSYPDVGKRGIGVGYPKGVNLVFDSEQMRLAMIWKGKFADPAGVWRSQGHGRVRPLGKPVIQFLAGPELDDVAQPWKVDGGRPPQHQFKGYQLDNLQRPVFQYRFDDVEVQDYCVDVDGDHRGSPILKRTLAFVAANRRNDLAFRVASTSRIRDEGSGTFSVGDSLRISVDDQHSAEIVEAQGGMHLRIPLELDQGTSTLILRYTW